MNQTSLFAGIPFHRLNVANGDFYGVYKGHTIEITQSQGDEVYQDMPKFYIVVIAPDGGSCYEAYAPEEVETLEQAVKEAIRGSGAEEPMPPEKETIDTMLGNAMSHQTALLAKGSNKERINHLLRVLSQQRVNLDKDAERWTEDDLARLSKLTDSPIEWPLWRLEHGVGYSVPEQILELVEEGILVDNSYRNDTCPQFEYCRGKYRLWVEHPDERKREFECQRFSIVDTEEEETLLETDDQGKVVMLITTQSK